MIQRCWKEATATSGTGHVITVLVQSVNENP